LPFRIFKNTLKKKEKEEKISTKKEEKNEN